MSLERPPADAPPFIGLPVFWPNPFVCFYLYHAAATLSFAPVWYLIALFILPLAVAGFGADRLRYPFPDAIQRRYERLVRTLPRQHPVSCATYSVSNRRSSSWPAPCKAAPTGSRGLSCDGQQIGCKRKALVRSEVRVLRQESKGAMRSRNVNSWLCDAAVVAGYFAFMFGLAVLGRQYLLWMQHGSWTSYEFRQIGSLIVGITPISDTNFSWRLPQKVAVSILSAPLCELLTLAGVVMVSLGLGMGEEI